MALTSPDRIPRPGGDARLTPPRRRRPTALAFLAGSAKPLLVTTAGSSPADSDLRWARGVADALPGAEHCVFTPEEFPGFFSDLDRVVPGMDEPCSYTAGGATRQRSDRWIADGRPTVEQWTTTFDPHRDLAEPLLTPHQWRLTHPATT